jgi:transposase
MPVNRAAACLRTRTKELPLRGVRRAGENLAGLYSLIATCEANGVNPVYYLADVLLRVQAHPASGIDELLPHHWTPLQREPSA